MCSLPESDPNPSGLCQCGCGRTTSIATRNHTKFGYVKGCHKRFVLGHYDRGNGPIARQSGWNRAQRIYPVLGACERCGRDAYDRHHKDGNSANNEPSNVQMLCRRCHMETDGRLERSRSQARENLPKLQEGYRIRCPHVPSLYRNGQPCPDCGKSLNVVSTRRRNGYKFTYIGCRKENGGCGISLGSIKTPIESHEEAA